ncbi:MAG: hypothetical protein ACPGVU_03985 [Limisphaerales bacterium]
MSSDKLETRILVVDDNPVSQMNLVEVLSREGYIVEAADDGQGGGSRWNEICPT